MHVLLIGAGGFLGRHLAAALVADGHVVTGTGRGPRPGGHAATHWQRVAPADLQSAEDWMPKLAGIDAIIWAAGRLRARTAGEFDAIHTRAPTLLAEAAARLGHLHRYVLISALGAGEDPQARYQTSKAAAERGLLAALPEIGVVLRPSLVYGPDGASTRWLRQLARLPWMPVPGNGDQRLQPVHVDDVCAAVCRLLRPAACVPAARIIALVGPTALTLRAYLAALRDGLGLPAAPVLPLALVLLHTAARGLAPLRMQPLCPETLAMLLRGNSGDPGALCALLGRSPRPVSAFAAGEHTAAERALTETALGNVCARAALALIWAAGGLTSLLTTGRDTGLALLAQLGVHGAAAWLLLLGGAGLDLLMALLTLHPAAGHRLWAVQAAIVTLYGAIVAFGLPSLLTDPLGAIVKNLALLALLGRLALHPER